MSSKELSFEEKQQYVQDSLIDVINSSVESSIVRFLKPEERTYTERQLQLLYSIFNGFVFIQHFAKKSKKTEYTIKLGKNFEDNLLSVDLEPQVVAGLKAWLRGASKALDNYFLDRYDGIYVGRLRFDFLTQDRKTFFIPNFRLETNIFLYGDLVTANQSHYSDTPEYNTNRLSYEKFVEDEWADLLIENDFRNNIK